MAMNHSLAAAAMAVFVASSLMASGAEEPIPAFLFGQNLEHTRSAVQGGISAQLVRNRKFAGKPTHDGVTIEWTGYGKRAVFDKLHNRGFVHHAVENGMFKKNEISSQFISSLDADGEAGIRQTGLALRGGIGYGFRAVVRTLNGDTVPFVVRVTAGGTTIAEKVFTVRSADEKDWQRLKWSFETVTNVTAELSLGVRGRTCLVIGAVSVLPDDNFHGFRRDVIECLREIGTSVIRWPGGNFAGEYRWRDDYIADSDERAPLQSYMEIETHPYTHGYDQNDFSTDDVIALCEELKAEPFFTLNAFWDSPADSAEWVSRCRGRVKLWSLGNEMGYGHMEGPKGPADYVRLVRPHAEAMLKVDPSLRLVSSGLYPFEGKRWMEGSGKPLADVAPEVSYHQYMFMGLPDFTTPARIDAYYAKASDNADSLFAKLRWFRDLTPREISISVDEWNLWYPWYRDDGISEGLFVAKSLHRFMREWKELGISCVCYFQAVNENAIRVGPFSSRLTSIGEAMRLMKGHVGGIPVALADQPVEVFVTDAKDGSRLATFFNFSTSASRTFRVPVGPSRPRCDGEVLVPSGLEIGYRYSRQPLQVVRDGDDIVVTLPPACMAAARAGK